MGNPPKGEPLFPKKNPPKGVFSPPFKILRGFPPPPFFFFKGERGRPFFFLGGGFFFFFKKRGPPPGGFSPGGKGGFPQKIFRGKNGEGGNI